MTDKTSSNDAHSRCTRVARVIRSFILPINRGQARAFLFAFLLISSVAAIPLFPFDDSETGVVNAATTTGGTVSSTNTTTLSDGSITPGYRDNFSTKKPEWATDSLASHNSTGEKAVLVDVSSSSKESGEWEYTPGTNNKSWYASADIDFESSSKSAARLWFQSDYVRSSVVTSDNGYRIEWTSAHDKVQIHDRSGGSWTQLASANYTLGAHETVAAQYNASGETLRVYVVNGGEHEEVINATGISAKSYNNFYWSGYKGSSESAATVQADNFVMKKWSGNATTAKKEPSDPDSVGAVNFSAGSVWNDWKIQNGTAISKNEKNADPTLFVEPNRTYPYHMLARDADSGSMDLYRSKDLKNWELQKENATPVVGNAGMIGADGKYYVYYHDSSNGAGVASASSLNGTWTDEGIIASHMYDPGIFYDKEKGRYYIFYEDGQVSGDPGSNKLGYASSTDPTFSSYTEHGNPINHTDSKWKTGDPEVIQVGDKYHLFTDKDRSHPLYGIEHHTTTALNDSSSWVRGDTFALTPNESTRASYGTGDPSIRFVNGTFHMFFEDWAADNSNWRVGHATSDGPWQPEATADVSVDTDGDGTLDSNTGPKTLNESYSKSYSSGNWQRGVNINSRASVSLSQYDSVYAYQSEVTLTTKNLAFRSDPSVIPGPLAFGSGSSSTITAIVVPADQSSILSRQISAFGRNFTIGLGSKEVSIESRVSTGGSTEKVTVQPGTDVASTFSETRDTANEHDWIGATTVTVDGKYVPTFRSSVSPQDIAWLDQNEMYATIDSGGNVSVHNPPTNRSSLEITAKANEEMGFFAAREMLAGYGADLNTRISWALDAIDLPF